MRHVRIAERLFNRPLMISEAKLNIIQHLFADKSGIALAVAPVTVEAVQVSENDRRKAGYQVNDGLAIIGIHGPLIHRRMDMEWPSGGPTTYGEIRKAFDLAMADDGVQGIVLDIDSGGGEVSGAFDLADHIYHSRGVKPITAVVDESAYSAAYLLASAAEKIILPRTGGVGSIGVIATHADFSRMEDAAGITVTHVYAGERKADYSPHQPLSDQATAALQEMVDDTYSMFVAAVARNRGMKKEEVIATQAAIYEGQKAVKAKLADAVSAVDTAIASARKGSNNRIISATGTTAGAQRKEKRTMTEQEMRDQHPDVVAAIEAKARQGLIAQADAETAKQEAVTAESERLMALVTAATGEDTAKRISAAATKGLTAEDLEALGVNLAADRPNGDGVNQQMLDAITGAAANGVRPGKQQTETDDRAAAVSAIAAAGSVR